MKRAFFILVFMLLASVNVYADWDPDLFQVTPLDDCYLVCPGGDYLISFCICYNGEPLELDASNVYMKIECNQGYLFMCPNEINDKSAFIKDTDCTGGARYRWMFRAGGCCEELEISLHIKNETESFYTTTVTLKSPDITQNGKVNREDESILLANIGTNDVCSDLNCDGVVDETDHEILLDHRGHDCNDWIGNEESSWGAIKSLYK